MTDAVQSTEYTPHGAVLDTFEQIVKWTAAVVTLSVRRLVLRYIYYVVLISSFEDIWADTLYVKTKSAQSCFGALFFIQCTS